MSEKKEKTKKVETKQKEKKTEKKNNKKKKINEFWKLAQEQLLDLGTQVLKKGITNLAVAKINETEVEIQKIVEEKIQKHSKKIIKNLVKIFSLLIAAAFLSYGILELILKNLNLSEYQNLIFGGIFLVVAFILNNKSEEK